MKKIIFLLTLLCSCGSGIKQGDSININDSTSYTKDNLCLKKLKINGHDYIDAVSFNNYGRVHCFIHNPDCKKCLDLYD